MKYGVMRYEINGRIYKFDKVQPKDEYYYGYCAKRKKWACLFDLYIQFDGEPPVAARKIE